MTPIVTALNESYLPGLMPLYNSYMQNSRNGFEFYAMVDGSKDLVKHVQGLGVSVIDNPTLPTAALPIDAQRWPDAIPSLYYRMLVPSLFSRHQRSIYIDVDSIILQSLQPIVDIDFQQPVAGTQCNSPLPKNIEGGGFDRLDVFGVMSSFLVFNNKAWRKKKILDKCIEAMESDKLHFPFVVQGVLQYALGVDWRRLPSIWQAHACHLTYQQGPIKDIYLLHFMGVNPWDDMPSYSQNSLDMRELWRSYE